MTGEITVMGIITTFLIDLTAGSVHEYAVSHFIDNLKKGGKPVNHDLYKGVRLSFFSALQDIVRECHQSLMRGAERIFPLFPADYPEEHRTELEWLDRKYKELAGEMKQIQKKNFTEGLPETIGEIESLLNPSGLSAEKKIRDDKEKLIKEALSNGTGSGCYENTVRENLFELVREYFVREIKHTPNIRHIFDSQLLVQIKSALKDLQKEQHQNNSLIEERLAIIEDLSKPSAAVKIHLDRDLNQLSNSELFWIIEEANKIVKMRMMRVESGSIALVFEGSPEECKRIREMFHQGKLKEIAGIPVKDVSIEDMPVETAESLKSEPSDDAEHLENVVINGIKYMISWLSPIWQPPLAGQIITAADISEKHHSFKTDDGEINISCKWKGASDDEPAYILLKWKANVIGNKTLLIRFVNSDTNQILSEFYMGNFFEGEEALTMDEVGFDPFTENWGITVALTEKSS